MSLSRENPVVAADNADEIRRLRNQRRNAKKRAAQKARRARARDLEQGHPEEREALIANDHEAINAQAPESDAPSPGFLSQTGSLLTGYAKAFGNGLLQAVKQPITTILAASTAAPPALNALSNPSGKTPDQIGQTWWDEMSNLTRVHSVVNTASSFSINFVMNSFFIPTAWNKFRTSIVHIFDNPQQFFDNVFSIVLGLGGAVAAGAIAYNAFLWLPYGAYVAGVPAGLSFIVTLASRYLGIKNIFKRIHNIFSKDAKNQSEFAEAIEHIKEDYLDELQVKLDDILADMFKAKATDKPLTPEEFEALTVRFTQALNELADAHPDLVKDKTTCEYIAKYTRILFDISLGLFIAGGPIFLTYMQKGFDGVKILAGFAGNDIDTMDVWLKRLIGLIPGTASFLFYTDYGTKISGIMTDLIKHLYENPRDIPFALAALVANGFSASGPQNVAAGVVKNENNIAFMEQGTPLASTYVILNAIGGGIINSGSSLNKAFLSTQKDAIHLDEKDLAKYLSKVDDHLMTHEITDQFRLFLDKVKHRSHDEAAHEEARLRHVDSVATITI